MKKNTDYYRQLTGNWLIKLLENTNNNYIEVFRHLNSAFSFSLLRDEYNQIIDYAKITKIPRGTKGIVDENGLPEFMHYYFGLTNDGEFTILITDSISDASPDSGWVFEKKLQGGLFDTFMNNVDPIGDKWKFIMNERLVDKEMGFDEKTRVTALKALSRYLKWNVFGEEWFKKKIIEIKKGVNEGQKEKSYTLLTMPFKSIENQFENSAVQTAHHFFGLVIKQIDLENPKLEDHHFDIIVTGDKVDLEVQFHNIACMCNNIKAEDIERYSLLPSFKEE